MIRSALAAVLFAASILSAAPSQACVIPPRAFHMHHGNLVDATETIVHARAIAANANGTVQFATIEALRGNPPPVFTVPDATITPPPDEQPQDFAQHRNPVFWDKFVTRQGMSSDCYTYPIFHKDREYLLFLDFQHARGYEEIASPDDLWLRTVRSLIAGPDAPSPAILDLPQWIRLATGSFIGRIQSCTGPTLLIDDVLHGTFKRRRWVYDHPKNPMYWPGQWPHDCIVGDRYFIVSYIDDPDAWPITYPRPNQSLGHPDFVPDQASTVYPILDGQIDFHNAIYHSEFQILGPQVIAVNNLRAVLRQP